MLIIFNYRYRDISNGKENVPVKCINNVDNEDLDGKFLYITKNCFTVDIKIDRKINSMQVVFKLFIYRIVIFFYVLICYYFRRVSVRKCANKDQVTVRVRIYP